MNPIKNTVAKAVTEPCMIHVMRTTVVWVGG